ncbi:MAG: hypothetical protein H6Q15_545 [Bacteroidetes bacterium]|nr:hypothetical protein [Bacteroidota bacterium]
MTKKKSKYKEIWYVNVHIKAKKGYEFNDLIDFEGEESSIVYKAAWANLLIRAISLHEVLELIPQGLAEKNFEVIFIDKIENMSTLIEFDEIEDFVIKEVDWLIQSPYKFMISDKIFPY